MLTLQSAVLLGHRRHVRVS